MQALPAKQIQAIVGDKGGESNGVFTISPVTPAKVHLHGVRIEPAFEVNASLAFQAEKNGDAFFNGDIPVRVADMNHVIDAIVGNHLIFQAEHQHFCDLSPVIWFVHFRGFGPPAAVAAEVHAVLAADRLPFGQAPPENPRTPFNWKRIKAILGASSAAVPDFDMVGTEINPVVSTMRAQGWDIGCLYNQETSESPQLYFSHEFKTGDPYELAAEIRKGLDRMAVEH